MPLGRGLETDLPQLGFFSMPGALLMPLLRFEIFSKLFIVKHEKVVATVGIMQLSQPPLKQK